MAKPLLIFLIVILAACSSAPRFYSGSGVLPEVKQSASQRYADAADSTQVLATEEGVASFYAEDFNGKPTYSGVIYNMHGLSAAHPTYPMGTIIRVTNLSNMKTVILEVNDRMPQHPDRIIDLSLGAADALGMREDGLQKVKIEVLKWGKGRK